MLAHAPSQAEASVHDRSFAYGGLDDVTRAAVKQATAAIHERLRRTAADVIAIGDGLLAVKARLPHGQFGPWLEAEFGWSEGHARRLMQVARAFGRQSDHGDRFAPTALYLLAAPSVPEAARAEARTRAQAGEPITPAAARAIIACATPVPEPDPEPDPAALASSSVPASVLSVAALERRAYGLGCNLKCYGGGYRLVLPNGAQESYADGQEAEIAARVNQVAAVAHAIQDLVASLGDREIRLLALLIGVSGDESDLRTTLTADLLRRAQAQAQAVLALLR